MDGSKKGGDPDGNRTRVTAVKGRCLNRLTTGPDKGESEHPPDAPIPSGLVAAVGVEPTTLRV